MNITDKLALAASYPAPSVRVAVRVGDVVHVYGRPGTVLDVRGDWVAVRLAGETRVDEWQLALFSEL